MNLRPVINDPEATRHPNPGGARPPQRIDDVLDALGTYWRANPDLRLGQILYSLAYPVDVRFIEDQFILTRLAEAAAPASGAIRYTVRTALRGARRLHVYRDVLTDPATGDFVASPLCKGAAEQTPGQTTTPWPADPFANPITANRVTCDRCWTAYDHLTANPLTTNPLGSAS